MKVSREADRLPPFVDVENPANKDYWISPALPCLPAVDTREEDRFEAFALTALLLECGKDRKPYIEIRTVRTGMTLLSKGTAISDGMGEDGLLQTLAYGSMPLEQFLNCILPPDGSSVFSYIFTFYEDGMKVKINTIVGRYSDEPQIIVDICRGYNLPKRNDDKSHEYGNITYSFDEGGKSLLQYAKYLKNRRRPKLMSWK